MPVLKDKPGFIRKWNVPKSLGNSHIRISPIDTPIVYKIEFKKTEYRSQIVEFNVTSKSIKEPELYSVPKMVTYWSSYDLSKPEDQVSVPISRPVKLLLHLPFGGTTTLDYTDDLELPVIPGYSWPLYTVKSEDIELYPIPEVHFALFYVNDELYYIVPFSLADKHYVEEILNYDTVPKFRRMFGKWVKKKSEGLLEYYVAEYSEYEEPKE